MRVYAFSLSLSLFSEAGWVLCYPPRCKKFTVWDWEHSFGVSARQTKSYSIIWDLKRSPLRKSLHLCYSSTLHLFILCLSSAGPKSYSPTRQRTTHNTHCTPDRYNRISNWISPHCNHEMKPCGQQWQEYQTKKKIKIYLFYLLVLMVSFWQGANYSFTSFMHFHSNL